jgi:hypothetical protein
VDFGGGPFGTQCAALDFRTARYFPLTQTKRIIVRFMRAHHKRVELFGAGVLLLSAGGAVWGGSSATRAAYLNRLTECERHESLPQARSIISLCCEVTQLGRKSAPSACTTTLSSMCPIDRA